MVPSLNSALEYVYGGTNATLNAFEKKLQAKLDNSEAQVNSHLQGLKHRLNEFSVYQETVGPKGPQGPKGLYCFVVSF